MLPPNHPDRLHIAFDDHRSVANASLILPLTLTHHLDLPQLVRDHLNLGATPRPPQRRRQDDDPSSPSCSRAETASTTPPCRAQAGQPKSSTFTPRWTWAPVRTRNSGPCGCIRMRRWTGAVRERLRERVEQGDERYDLA